MLKPFATTRLVTYYFIQCYHQLHSSDSPNSTYHWHVPRKWMGSAITAITFPYFLTDKERYNPLDYFRMAIIEELRFFFFWRVEDPAGNQKLWVKWCEVLKNKVCGLRRKEVKIYIRHSQKNLRHYICSAIFKGVFRTHVNILHGAFLRNQLTAFAC